MNQKSNAQQLTNTQDISNTNKQAAESQQTNTQNQPSQGPNTQCPYLGDISQSDRLYALLYPKK